MNSIVRAPVAEIGRHGLLAGNVGFARHLVDGARGAHLGGQEILQLALAGITQADPHLLALRRRVDVHAAHRRELGHRVGIRQVDPMRAAIERHAEAFHIGDATAADVIGRFDHHIAPPGGGKTARRGDPGGASPDDDDLERTRGRRRRRRSARGAGRQRGGGGEKRTSAETGEVFPAWFPNAYGSPQIARTAPGGQTLRFNLGQ